MNTALTFVGLHLRQTRIEIIFSALLNDENLIDERQDDIKSSSESRDSHVRRAILNVTCNSIALYGNPRDMTPRTSSEARRYPCGPHREATCRHVHGDTRSRGPHCKEVWLSPNTAVSRYSDRQQWIAATALHYVSIHPWMITHLVLFASTVACLQTIPVQ